MTDDEQDGEFAIYSNTFESTGRQSADLNLTWSSVTEAIQFADSDSSDDRSDNVTANKERSLSVSTIKSSANESYSYEFETADDDEHSSDSNKGSMASSKSKVSLSHVDSIEDTLTKHNFLRQKMDILKNKPRIRKSHVRQSTEQNDVESEEYSKQKIKLVRNKLKSKNLQQKPYKKKQPPKPVNIVSKSNNMLKNTRQLEKLKIENAVFKVEKKIASPLHQPRHCRKCRQLQSKLSEKEYIKRKTAQLSKQQVSVDLENHLYMKDSATLIADIIKSGPKPSDPPQEIWDRLLRKGKYFS